MESPGHVGTPRLSLSVLPSMIGSSAPQLPWTTVNERKHRDAGIEPGRLSQGASKRRVTFHI
jgi:hypothetical protein